MSQDIANDVGAAEEAAPPFFVVSTTKFLVMSVFTFGFYGVFWFFMHWKAVREREGSRIWPAVRGILLPFVFCHALFVRFRGYGAQFGYKPLVPIWVVTTAFIVATIYGVLTRDLDGVPLPAFLINFVMIPLILLPMQILADKINMRVAPAYPYNRDFSLANIAGIVIGTVVFVLIGLGYYAKNMGM